MAPIQPVTPPIFIRSGMAKSLAPAAIALAMSATNHQFSPVWIGAGDAARIAAWPDRSSAATGSSIQQGWYGASRSIRRCASVTVRD